MNQERLMNIIIAPHVSEKGTRVADENRQFVFKVARNARKPEIKRAIEFLFKVEVRNVRVLNVKGKRKTFGRLSGRRSDWKKAYVSLEPGHDIDFSGSE